MTQHYGATFPRSSESSQRLKEMENLLNQVMKLLPEEQVENVHKYLESNGKGEDYMFGYTEEELAAAL